MIRTTPLRRTTLQCSQRALTDGLTFISALALLLEPIRDAAPRQIVGRQLHLHPIAGQDPDEVHPHLAAHVGEHAMAVLQLHAEHRVGEGFHHGALDLDRVFFGHVQFCSLFERGLGPRNPCLGEASERAIEAPSDEDEGRSPPPSEVRTSGPLSVTAIVCSKCAARLPSLVTAVHPSSRIFTSNEPIVTIGSMASTMPALSWGPWPGSPKFGICGSSCRFRPIPWPTNARTTPKPWASTCRCTAWEMSLRRCPGRHCVMARSRLSRVTSSSS